MTKALEKIKKLVAKHRKDIAPVASKDEPALLRMTTKNDSLMRQDARKRNKIAYDLDENADTSNGKSDDVPIRRDEKKDAAAKKVKQSMKDGAVMVDPDEKLIGNPDVKSKQASESVLSWKEFQEEKMSARLGTYHNADMKAKAANDNDQPTYNKNGTHHTVVGWHKDNVVSHDGETINASDGYENYTNWCNEKGHEPLALPTWSSHWNDMGIRKARVGGRVRRIDVKLRDNK